MYKVHAFVLNVCSQEDGIMGVESQKFAAFAVGNLESKLASIKLNRKETIATARDVYPALIMRTSTLPGQEISIKVCSHNRQQFFLQKKSEFPPCRG